MNIPLPDFSPLIALVVTFQQNPIGTLMLLLLVFAVALLFKK